MCYYGDDLMKSGSSYHREAPVLICALPCPALPRYTILSRARAPRPWLGPSRGGQIPSSFLSNFTCPWRSNTDLSGNRDVVRDAA